MAKITGRRALGSKKRSATSSRASAQTVIFDLDLPEWRPLLDSEHGLVYSASAASVADGARGRERSGLRRHVTRWTARVIARVERMPAPTGRSRDHAARPKWR